MSHPYTSMKMVEVFNDMTDNPVWDFAQRVSHAVIFSSWLTGQMNEDDPKYEILCEMKEQLGAIYDKLEEIW